MNTSTLSASALLIPFLFFTACGPLLLSGGGDSEVDNSIYNVDGPGKSVRESLERADLDCFSSECPSNVGMIALSETGRGGASGQCTGFLIADDIVATNSHCIPDTLKTSFSTKDCANHIAIRFLPSSGKEEIFSCTEVIAYSDHEASTLAQDYAFFRITPTGRKVFSIHKGGVKDQESLTISRVTPKEYTFGGTVGKLKCSNVHNSIGMMSVNSSWSKIGFGVGCQIVSGNSGSPVLNRSGAVVGVASASWLEKVMDSLLQLAGRLDSTFDSSVRSFPDHAIFTNFSCVKDPVTNRQKSRLCELNDSLEFAQCAGLKSAEVNYASLFESTKKWAESLDNNFLYKVTRMADEKEPENSDSTIKSEPLCVKNTPEWTLNL